MSKRWGSVAIGIAIVAIAGAVLFVPPIWFGGATPLQSALLAAIVLGAIIAAWIAEFMYRKSFPNLFRAFDKERPNGKVAGEGDE
jgi:hypothetical protein